MLAYELICLHKARILDVQSIRRNPGKSRIVEHYHAIRMIDQALHRQQRIVGLDNDVGGFWEDGIGLYEFLWKAIVQPFEEKGA